MNRSTSWPAHAAAAWALIFAACHIVWAAGWYVGLDPDFAARAFAQPAFLIYDLAVATLCIVAAAIALALGHPGRWHIRPVILASVAAAGTALLVLRSAASIIQHIALALTGRLRVSVMTIWEAWFCLGAALFSLSLWRYWRTRRATPSLTGARP